LVVKLVSIFTVGKERNVASIQKENARRCY